MKRDIIIGAGLLVASSWGCAASKSDTASKPDTNATATDEQYTQVARSIAGSSGASGELGAIGIAHQLALGIRPIGLVDDGLGHFHGDWFGLHYVVTVECFDALGQAMVACGPTTSSADVSTAWSGSLTLPRFSIDAMRTGSWRLTNLQLATTTLNGASHLSVTSQFASASNDDRKTLSATIDADYHDVLVEGSTLGYVGGEIDYVIVATSAHHTPGVDDRDSFIIDGILTFSANRAAHLQLDCDHDFDLDEQAGDVRAPAGGN